MLDWIGDHPLIAVLAIMTTLAFICQGIAALVEKKGPLKSDPKSREETPKEGSGHRPRKTSVASIVRAAKR
jgi:hypothetical protein